MLAQVSVRQIFLQRLTSTGLYVLFDPRTRNDWLEQLVEVAALGVGIMQLRAKGADRHQLAAWASRLKKQANLSTLVILNDQPDLAADLGFAGVHVGAADSSPAEARRCLGVKAIVGASANTAARLKALATYDLDYFGVGAYRATASKSNTSRILGLQGLRELLPLATRPVVAIGGIMPSDVAALRVAGVAGVAIYSAIWLADKPAVAAGEFVRAWQAAS